MGARHSDAAAIAEWKDDLNQVWADLLELIDTRTQMLAASRELHKFFHDCKVVLGRIVEKQNTPIGFCPSTQTSTFHSGTLVAFKCCSL